MSAQTAQAEGPTSRARLARGAGIGDDLRILRWTASYLRPHCVTLAVAVLAMVGGSMAEVIPPALMRRIVDDVVVGRHFERLASCGLALVGALVTSNLLSGVHQVLTRRLTQDIVHRMRMDIHGHLQRLSLDFLECQRTGDLMSRASNDVGELETFLSLGAANIFTDVLCIGGILAMVFWISPPLALLALAPVPLFLLSTVAYAAYLRPTYRRIRDALGSVNAVVQEGLVGVRVVRAFGREEQEQRRFEQASAAVRDQSARAQTLASIFFPLSALLVSCSVLLVVWVGVAASDGEPTHAAVTAGTITALVAYLQQFYWRLGDLLRVYTVHTRALAAVARILEVPGGKLSVRDAPGALTLDGVRGHVRLSGVSFRYATGEMVLRHITLEAHPGQMIALVGRSGAGKTTLVNLIARFYDPTEGQVLVDGHDLRGVTQASPSRAPCSPIHGYWSWMRRPPRWTPRPSRRSRPPSGTSRATARAS
ncbi:MAG: ABC transporter ATP-binding protein [Armatimonadetes bacterium]|nr:ABC transporter ATP-binding protein [Armatimonadota bacterium]